MRANLTKHDGVYDITTAQTVGGRRKPRTRCIALTDCVCYDADGNVIRTIPRVTPATRTKSKSTTTTTVEPTRYDSRRDLILAATMGTVHSEQ